MGKVLGGFGGSHGIGEQRRISSRLQRLGEERAIIMTSTYFKK